MRHHYILFVFVLLSISYCRGIPMPQSWNDFLNNNNNMQNPSTQATPLIMSQRFLDCTRNCQTTPQYDPVCGTDSQTYHNSQRLDCARRCGLAVRVQFPGSCLPL